MRKVRLKKAPTSSHTAFATRTLILHSLLSSSAGMEMMVEAGMTPMQVIVAATGGGARITKVDPRIGSIEPGKWADLLVLNANPLDDIRNTRQIHSVWIGGNRVASVH